MYSMSATLPPPQPVPIEDLETGKPETVKPRVAKPETVSVSAMEVIQPTDKYLEVQGFRFATRPSLPAATQARIVEIFSTMSKMNDESKSDADLNAGAALSEVFKITRLLVHKDHRAQFNEMLEGDPDDWEAPTVDLTELMTQITKLLTSYNAQSTKKASPSSI